MNQFNVKLRSLRIEIEHINKILETDVTEDEKMRLSERKAVLKLELEKLLNIIK